MDFQDDIRTRGLTLQQIEKESIKVQIEAFKKQYSLLKERASGLESIIKISKKAMKDSKKDLESYSAYDAIQDSLETIQLHYGKLLEDLNHVGSFIEFVLPSWLNRLNPDINSDEGKTQFENNLKDAKGKVLYTVAHIDLLKKEMADIAGEVENARISYLMLKQIAREDKKKADEESEEHKGEIKPEEK